MGSILHTHDARFRWKANSIAFWDNRSTRYQAILDYCPHERYGHRVTVCGDKPFGVAAGTVANNQHANVS